MPDERSRPSGNKTRTGLVFLAVAAGATAAGATAAAIFAMAWFPEVSTHCGVVRGYEYLWGLFVLGVWLFSSLALLVLAHRGFKKQTRVLYWATVLAACVNAAMIMYCFHAGRSIANEDFALESRETLMGFLEHGNHDQQIIAALALGRKTAWEAVPLLCTYLLDEDQDVNLRHNAATALGLIYQTPDGNRFQHRGLALDALVGALETRREHLPMPVCRSLGAMGEPAAVPALAAFLSDGSRSAFVREEAALALAAIGNKSAWKALQCARGSCTDPDLNRVLDSLLKNRK